MKKLLLNFFVVFFFLSVRGVLGDCLFLDIEGFVFEVNVLCNENAKNFDQRSPMALKLFFDFIYEGFSQKLLQASALVDSGIEKCFLGVITSVFMQIFEKLRTSLGYRAVFPENLSFVVQVVSKKNGDLVCGKLEVPVDFSLLEKEFTSIYSECDFLAEDKKHILEGFINYLFEASKGQSFFGFEGLEISLFQQQDLV